MHIRGRLLLLSFASSLCCVPTAVHAQTAVPFAPGQSVEVREGDEWSKATVVAREGRKYQIKYADGTQDWVTTDRVRAGGTGPAPSVPATQPTAAKPKPVIWAVGQEVEVKWGGMWRKAKVVNRRGEWLMIDYDGRGAFIEWVEPWRVRKIGSTDDIGYATPNSAVRKTDPPPRDKPGAAPEVSAREKPNDAFAPEAFDFPLTPVDRSGVKAIAPSTSGKWAYTPSAAAPPRPPLKPLGLLGPLQKDAATGAFDLVRTRAMVGYTLNRGDDKGTSIELIDTATGKSRQLRLDKATRPLALTPDGTRVIARAEGFFGGTKHRVDVWDVAGTEAKHVVSFIPHPDAGHGRAGDIDELFVIDDWHVLTRSGATLTCWKIDGARAVWTMEAGTHAVAHSPDRKTLAVAADDAIHLIDAASGEPRGTIREGVPVVAALAFGPSGKRLFGSTSGGGVVAFDLVAGTAAPIVAMRTATAFTPLSDRLVDLGPAVIDVEAGTLVARLSVPRQQTRMVGDMLVGLADSPAKSLRAWKLPPAALESMVATATTATTAKQVRLDRGTNVTLDVSLPVDAKEAETVLRELRETLTKAGLQIVDGAAIRIVARVEDGKSEERMYESRGIPRFDQERLKVTVVEKITRLWIEADGKKAWEVSQSAWPSTFVTRKEGQSIPEAVQEASKPSVAFLGRVALPRVIITDEATGLRTVELGK